HYLHYVVGDSTLVLDGVGVTPGSWDQENEPLILWEVQFNFFCAGCNLIPLYNVRIIEVLPGGGETVRWPVGEAFETGLQTFGENAYPDITIEELNQLTIMLPQTSGLKIVASRTDPATIMGAVPDNNVQLAADPLTQAAVYPPSQHTEPVVIQAVLLEVNETSPGIFETTTLASDSAINTQPRYESRSDGFYKLPTPPEEPTETFLTTSQILPPATVDTTAMLTDAEGNPHDPALPQEIPIPVPEPGTGGALLAGIAALLALGRRRQRISGL
ncbi:MAG TPA: PEP-CTERM sorting domain-containing protein, partial [Myxococcales bacterium]|nr:PEP-CTERM sorting domain-containing protein [Myxococcales bacterium]